MISDGPNFDHVVLRTTRIANLCWSVLIIGIVTASVLSFLCSESNERFSRHARQRSSTLIS
jgi:hypothetical protein